jgi:hypothetical protein
MSLRRTAVRVAATAALVALSSCLLATGASAGERSVPITGDRSVPITGDLSVPISGDRSVPIDIIWTVSPATAGAVVGVASGAAPI